MNGNKRITYVESPVMKYCPACMEKISDAQVCPFCGSLLNRTNESDLLPVGYCLHDRYLIGIAIGNGGFGTVYVAFDRRLLRKVAVKEFYPRMVAARDEHHFIYLDDPSRRDVFETGKKHFLSEGQSIAKFHEHPAIVDVMDTFEENDTAYIIMEYLEGITLEHYLEQNKPLPFTKALEMMNPVISSLKMVHHLGMVHRDISPSNIMILKDGKIKLMDFGIAGEYADEGEMLNATKDGYSPLEQYGKKYGPQGPWTDVYALCATLYFMITGLVPTGSIKRIGGGELTTPTSAGAVIDMDKEKALLKGMSTKYEERYQSVYELEHAFENRPASKTKHWILGTVLLAGIVSSTGIYVHTHQKKEMYIYKDYSSEENHFQERILMYGEDMSLVSNMDETCTDSPHSGITCIRCEQETVTGDWGGWMFVNSYIPDGEEIPVPCDGKDDTQGIDLTGARSLTFCARGECGGEIIEFFTGGFGYDEWGNILVDHPDSSKKQSTGFITLTKEWIEYSIELPGDMSSTLCGFGYALNADLSGEGNVVFYLDDIRFRGNIRN